ncbi:MAG: GGDEF domain-containing protein [Cellulosilyticaceae bacterium]
MIIGKGDLKQFQSIYCVIKWILIFILFFTLDEVVYSNINVFEEITIVLVCVSVWNGCVYYAYRMVQDNELANRNINIVEIIGDIISITYIAKAQGVYGDGFVCTLFIFVAVVVFVRFGHSAVSYVLISCIIIDVYYIYQAIYIRTHILKEQKFYMIIALLGGVIWMAYYIIKENERLKLLLSLKDTDVQDLEQNLKELNDLKELSAIVYKSNEIDGVVSSLLSNIYKVICSEGIGIILYGDNNVESDAKWYNYVEILKERAKKEDNLPFQNFYAQNELQNLRDHKSYKHCILSHAPIRVDIEANPFIKSLLPDKYDPYIYFFNIIKPDGECGLVICNTKERLEDSKCKQIDELVKYAGLALVQVQRLEDEKKKFKIDALTGINSRRYIDELMPEMIKRAEENKDYICILFADIDHFKYFNDTFGHKTGDFVLKEVANILKNNIVDDAIVGRFGGEEFVGMLYGKNEEESMQIAEKIRENVQQFKVSKYTGKNTYITISIGVAVFCGNECCLEEMIHCADSAMYEAKKERNKVVLYRKEV